MTPSGAVLSLRARVWPSDGEAPLPWFAELLGVSGLLVAQPIYSVYRASADTFVWQRADGEILWWALAVLLLPAVVLVVPGVMLRWWRPGTAQLVHAVAVGLVCGLLAARTVAHLQLPPGSATTQTWVLLGVIVVLVAGAAARARVISPAFRSWLRILALAPVVLCASFLFSSPVRDIAFAQGTGALVTLDLADPPPVMFLVYDELPLASMLGEDGTIDADLLPNFARLAGQSTLYRNVTTVSPSSPTAIPALLSGTYPASSDVPPIADSYPENLFTLLASAYDLNVWESVAQLCPPQHCASEGAGIPRLLGEAADTWVRGFVPTAPSEREPYKPPQSQPRAPDVFEEFVASVGASGEVPRLDFLHIILPHQPWYHLPSGAKHDGPFLAPGLVGSTYAWGDEYVAAAGRQRHLLQLVRTDELLGILIDRMQELGTWDDTLVVLTADHGVAFTEGEPIRGVSLGNAEQVMWVPLLVKEPGQRSGALDDTPGRVIDVLPTLAGLLGAELPWPVDGVALDQPRPSDVEERRMLRWAFNDLLPPVGEEYVTIDGIEGFARLLALPPATPPGSDPLKPWRFGRWGHLVGEPLDALEVSSSDARTTDLADPDCARATRRDPAAVPVYICGTIETTDAFDVVVAVNGTVGGWGRTRPMKQEGWSEWFVLVPDDLLTTSGTDTIEVFQATEDASAPRGVVLEPIAVAGTNSNAG